MSYSLRIADRSRKENQVNLCLWSRIPKTGSTSLHERFVAHGVYRSVPDTEAMLIQFPNATVIDCWHSTPQQIVERGWFTEDALRRAFVFTVVRNPWARFASLWFGIGTDERWTDSFEEFLTEALLNPQPATKQTSFAASQTEWLMLGEVPIVDLTMRMERLDDEFPMLAGLLGIENVPLGLHNVHDHPPYTGLYNERTIDLVANIDAWTIKRFGYRYGEDLKCTMPAFNRK